MVGKQRKEMAIGAAMLAVGVAYLFLVADLPRRGPVDSTFIPYVLSGAMILLGLAQLTTTWLKPVLAPAPAGAGDDETGLARPNYGTVAKTLALFAIFIALLRPIGFPFAAALYLFFQFVVLTPGGRKPSYGLYAFLAVLCSVVIFVAFRYGFDLILPSGPLVYYLP